MGQVIQFPQATDLVSALDTIVKKAEDVSIKACEGKFEEESSTFQRLMVSSYKVGVLETHIMNLLTYLNDEQIKEYLERIK